MKHQLVTIHVLSKVDHIVMELIQAYSSQEESATSGTDSTSEDDEHVQLREHQVRTVYLVTYSQADVTRFTRQSFAESVVACFNEGRANVVQWACSQENHAIRGSHFHLCIKLDRLRRWLGVKRQLLRDHNISVHFSAQHADYYSAWRYVTKEDQHYIYSDDHPDLRNGPPRTSRASAARRNDNNGNEDNNGEEPPRKRVRLTALQVSDIIRRNNVTTLLQLQLLVNSQAVDGKYELQEFYLARSKSKISELIASTWDIEHAPARFDRSNQTRLQLLQSSSEGICNCAGQWQYLALQTLQRNNIDLHEYTNAVYNLLDMGRGKHRNIIHVGPTNCAKSFLLNPLRDIYECFHNPATSTFNWLGVEQKEIILLNDFRWSPAMLPWHDLLLLLEGDTVNFPAPKNEYARNITLVADTPIFATSSDTIKYVKYNTVNDKETRMMASRWKVFHFFHEIRESEVIDMKPCKACYANFVLQYRDV